MYWNENNTIKYKPERGTVADYFSQYIFFFYVYLHWHSYMNLNLNKIYETHILRLSRCEMWKCLYALKYFKLFLCDFTKIMKNEIMEPSAVHLKAFKKLYTKFITTVLRDKHLCAIYYLLSNKSWCMSIVLFMKKLIKLTWFARKCTDILNGRNIHLPLKTTLRLRFHDDF